jgi:tetratricopeptide (TPR) repeat protein
MRAGALSVALLLAFAALGAAPPASVAEPAAPATGAPVPPPLPDLAGVEPQVAAKITAARRYVLTKPTSPHAWGVLAMSLDVHGFKAEALPCYEEAARLAPDDVRWPYYRAIVLADEGSPEALEWFAAARTLAPGYAPLLVRQGDALATAGEPEKAAEAFTAAAAAPDLPQPHVGLARLALARGDLGAALREAQAAVAADAACPEAHGLLAEIYRRRGEGERAAAERRLVARLPPLTRLPDPLYAALAAEGVSSYWYRQRGRAYLEKGDYEGALRELEQALAASPNADTHDDLGLALQHLGRFEEAAAHHRAALALRPDSAESRAHLGEALAGLGRLDEAISALEEAVAARPDLPGADLDLGTFYARAGHRRDAAAAFRKAVELAPDDPRPAARLAWLLATAPEDDLRDGGEAVRLAEEASAATGGRLPEALDVLAAAYAEAGRFSDAVETARRALSLAQARPGGGELAGRLAARLTLYEAGQPYREAE